MKKPDAEPHREIDFSHAKRGAVAKSEPGKTPKEVHMSVSLKSLGIDQLSVDERLALVEELWDSIADSNADLPLTNTQRAELDRRLAEHEANPNDVVPWEDIKASIDARLKR